MTSMKFLALILAAFATSPSFAATSNSPLDDAKDVVEFTREDAYARARFGDMERAENKAGQIDPADSETISGATTGQADETTRAETPCNCPHGKPTNNK